MNRRWIAIGLGGLLLLLTPSARAATVEGFAYLEGQSDHSGITVELTGSRVIPALTGVGLALLAAGLGLALRRRRPGPRLTALGIVLGAAALAGAGFAGSRAVVQTGSDGHFVFTGVNPGAHRLAAGKDCYTSPVIDPLLVQSDDVVVEPLQLGPAAPANETATQSNLARIACAQHDYNSNSMPHTYSGELACLVSGNGAGGIGFLPQDFEDGTADGYQYLLEGGLVVAGSIWTWSATAFPIAYQCTGVRSFYIDEGSGGYTCLYMGLVCGEDLGGAPAAGPLACECPEGGEELSVLRGMVSIAQGETDYNNNSMPHTYTGNLACLASGTGAGGVGFICPPLGTGNVCDYQFYIEADDYVYGSYWSWWCTAWPLVYGGSTTLTFYADESGVIRAGDIGGAPGTIDLPSVDLPPELCSEFTGGRPGSRPIP